MKLAAITVALAMALAGCTSPGDPAPDFNLVDSEGNAVALSDFEGQPVVLFFASVVNCYTCAAETVRHLVPLYDEVGEDVAFLTVSVVPFQESDDDLNQFKNDTGATWSHARDTDGLTQAYGIQHLGTLFVLDEDHRIVFEAIDPPKHRIQEFLS